MAKLVSTDKLLAPAVTETLNALNLGPQDAGLARLAMLLAWQIDALEGDQRAAMLPQTAGLLHRVLDTLAKRKAAPRSGSKLQALRDARNLAG